MTKNPFVNAGLAVLYIIIVVEIMQFGGPIEKADVGVLAPIAFLSLFVLSAAVMSYLFFYQPVCMYVEGEKQQAASLFVRTVLVFALYTTAILAFVFSVTA